MYRVLIAAFANYDAVTELPHILKKGGCTVHVLCAADSWAIKSKGYDRWIPTPGDVDNFRDDLIALATRTDDAYDWIILADDPTIRLMNDHIGDNESLFYRLLPLTKIENREILGTKSGFSHLCTKYGIRTPKYIIYEEGMDLNNAAGEIGFPMLVKIDKSEGGGGVFFCNNMEEFETTMASITEREHLVFQQYIKGPVINTEVLYKNGSLIMYNYSKTTKTLYNEFGVSTQRLCYTNHEVEADLMEIGSSFGLTGFGNVVFMYNELDNKHYLIEVDMRPNAWIFYAKFCGNDFSSGVNKYINNDLTFIRKDPAFENKDVTMIIFKKDMARCLVDKDIKGLTGWIFNKNGCWKFIPFYDRKLLSATMAYIIKLYKDAIIHKVFKKTPN